MSASTTARLREVPVGTASLERFRSVLNEEQWERLERAAARARRDFEGRVVWNVNSTARGGGVAELLGALIPYTRAAGVDVRWVVIEGDPAFFRITKRLHNLLHGAPGDGAGVSPADEATYVGVSETNARELVALVRPGDLVLLHDPQTAGLVEPLQRHGARVVWRCHVGADRPNAAVREAWSFLLPRVEAADRIVFSRLGFVWDGLDRSRVAVIPPSIDAFAPKNQPLSPDAVDSILRACGVYGRRNASKPLPAAAPAVVQVSRWDRLKDPAGVLEAFADGIAPTGNAHLVLAAQARRMPADQRERVHLFSLPMEDVQRTRRSSTRCSAVPMSSSRRASPRA